MVVETDTSSKLLEFIFSYLGQLFVVVETDTSSKLLSHFIVMVSLQKHINSTECADKIIKCIKISQAKT